jgi:hypothetical protein
MHPLIKFIKVTSREIGEKMEISPQIFTQTYFTQIIWHITGITSSILDQWDGAWLQRVN